MRQPETDLLGEPLAPLRKDGMRRKTGYAARPGTGPKGQRCNTCTHAQLMRSATRRAWKCAAVTHAWDDTPESDIKPGAPACKEWERKHFKHANR